VTDQGVTARRQLATAALGCAAGALVQLLAQGRVWVAVPGGGSWTGHALSSAVRPLALAELAGAVALVATRRWGRTAVGVLLVAVAAGAAVAAANAHDPHVAGPLQHNQAWRVVYVVAALVVLAAGAAGAVRGRRWSEMSARYESPGATRQRDPEVELWEALDRGDDPTG
jgi:hypothetical protein